jgi:hypothetical protein
MVLERAAVETDAARRAYFESVPDAFGLTDSDDE